MYTSKDQTVLPAAEVAPAPDNTTGSADSRLNPPDDKPGKSRGRLTAKLASGTFWIIMAIHIVVFTSIGLFTDRGWRLLVIFLAAFIPTVLVIRLTRRYLAKRKLVNN